MPESRCDRVASPVSCGCEPDRSLPGLRAEGLRRTCTSLWPSAAACPASSEDHDAVALLARTRAHPARGGRTGWASPPGTRDAIRAVEDQVGRRQHRALVLRRQSLVIARQRTALTSTTGGRGAPGSAARTGSAGLPDTGSAHPAPRRCLGRPAGGAGATSEKRVAICTKRSVRNFRQEGARPLYCIIRTNVAAPDAGAIPRQQEESASICASGVPSYAADHKSHTCVTTLVAFARLAVDGATG